MPCHVCLPMLMKEICRHLVHVMCVCLPMLMIELCRVMCVFGTDMSSCHAASCHVCVFDRDVSSCHVMSCHIVCVFCRSVKRQLEPEWHRVGFKTKQVRLLRVQEGYRRGESNGA